MPPRRGQSSSLSPLPEWCNELLEFEQELAKYYDTKWAKHNGPPTLSTPLKEKGTSIINQLSEEELLYLYKMCKSNRFQQYFDKIWYYFIDYLGFNKNNLIETNAEKCTSCDKKFSIWLGRHHCRSCGQANCFNCVKPISSTSKLVILKKKDDSNYKDQVWICNECLKTKGGSKKKKKKSTKKIIKVVAGKKRVIHTGPKGGKYYISKGSKRYI
jgi:hypothetical protein